MRQKVQVSIVFDVDPSEFPESKLNGTLEDMISDNLKCFIQDGLGGDNIQLSTKRVPFNLETKEEYDPEEFRDNRE